MKHFPTLCFTILALTASAGCSSLKSNGDSWNPMKSISAAKEDQTKAEPVSMAVIWKDSVYEQPGATSIKGFGGRLFIYDSDNRPIRADGELVVYGYDETNTIDSEREHNGADKKFVFPRETLQRHYSDSDLGPSYSVWIPWEEVGGIRKSITLIPILKTAGGNALRCGHSMIVLPGRKPKMANANISGSQIANTPNLVAQASFQQPAADQANGHISQVSATTDISPTKSGIRTTTFSLPPSLGKKMSANQAPPKTPTEISLPRLDPSAEPTRKTFTPSGSSSETEASAADLPQPAPRIFGMPGSF